VVAFEHLYDNRLICRNRSCYDYMGMVPPSAYRLLGAAERNHKF